MAKFVALFVGVPAALALAGARLASRRPAEAVALAIVAGALGAAVWLLLVWYLASQGVFE